MFHTLAWSASATNNVATDLTPVQDDIFVIQNSHFLPQRNFNLLYAAAMSADMQRARIITPSLRQFTTPYIRPVEGNLQPSNNPNYADYRANPLLIRALEELEIEGLQDGAGAARITVVAGLAPGAVTPMPTGDIYTMLGTATTTLTANAWTSLTMTWADTLPTGRYAVVGGEVVSATGQAFRLIFEDQYWRPGGLAFGDEENGARHAFRMGGLGEWGRFSSNRMPTVQVLATAADTAETVYLDFVRVG